MSRPCKRRRVCAMPGCGRFGPVEGNTEQRVIMSVDEFEAIRLIDYEGLTQEACAERMEVARTTAGNLCCGTEQPCGVPGGGNGACD